MKSIQRMKYRKRRKKERSTVKCASREFLSSRRVRLQEKGNGFCALSFFLDFKILISLLPILDLTHNTSIGSVLSDYFGIIARWLSILKGAGVENKDPQTSAYRWRKLHQRLNMIALYLRFHVTLTSRQRPLRAPVTCPNRAHVQLPS